MAAILKEAVVEDAELISQLATETFFETYSWYNTPGNMQAYTQTHFNAALTKKEIQQEETKFFLLFENGEPVGYTKLRVVETPPELGDKKHIEIERIYVLKKHQKKKFGFELIKKCIAYAIQKNYEIIWLGVWEQNPKATSFYEKIGFVKFGEHVFQLGDDMQKDYLMKFDLT